MTISHSLAAIGEALSDNELLFAILNGLDQDYDTVVSLITYQMDDIDLEKVQYLLLMHEQRLVAKNVPQSSLQFELMSSNMNVSVVSHQSNGNFGHSRGIYTQRGGGSRFR